VKTLTLIGIAAGLAISLSTAAHASPILEGTTTDPTGIDNLVVDGTTYDVMFSLTTLNTFSQGSTLSMDAETALASALNSLSVTELGNTNSITYLLDVDNSLAMFDAAEYCQESCPTSWTYDSSGSAAFGVAGPHYTEAADFTAVPEPATLAVFGAGLLGLGFIYRRRSVNRVP
jgi:hypothetical protein